MDIAHDKEIPGAARIAGGVVSTLLFGAVGIFLVLIALGGENIPLRVICAVLAIGDFLFLVRMWRKIIRRR